MMEFIVNYDLNIFNNLDELSEYFAEVLGSLVNAAKEKFNLALSGGSTPKYIFKYLAAHDKTKVRWGKINVFWGDERCVPPIDNESNYKMAYETLLSKVPIIKENIFRIKGEANPLDEAIRYSNLLRAKVIVENNFPRFDFIMLGLGEDGHIASIFPNQMNLLASDKICQVAIHPESKQKRVTLTGEVINNARNVAFIVTGKAKSKIVNEILNKNINATKYPAGFINPIDGNLIWLLDEDAASLLKAN